MRGDGASAIDLVVIPARYGSTRFPGKPLALIAGRTLLERVVDLARCATRHLPDVAIVVATDHHAIAEHAAAIDCEAVMTDPAITSGTGRALAVARQLSRPPRFVVNLQGDAPFVPPSSVAALLSELGSSGAGVTTPVVQLDWAALDRLREQKRTSPFSGTTCVRTDDGVALWFSKAILPALRYEPALRATGTLSPVFRHLGLYGYTYASLERFEAGAPSRYEQLEGLEQLRLLESGIAIRTVLVDDQRIPMSGIDTPADVLLAEALIAEHGDPFAGA